MITFRHYVPPLMIVTSGGRVRSGGSPAAFYISALLGFVCLCIVPVIRKHEEQARALPGQARTVPRKGEKCRESCRHLWKL